MFGSFLRIISNQLTHVWELNSQTFNQFNHLDIQSNQVFKQSFSPYIWS